MLAGGALAGITVAMPPAAEGSDLVVLAMGAVSALVGAMLMLTRRTVPEWQLGIAAALGTVLITVATYEGGFDGTGTADNQMLYIWVCLFSFYFLDTRHAIGQTAFVGVAYAWLLDAQTQVEFNDAATRWVVTMATLLIAGLLVARLRGSLDRLLGELTDRARVDSLTGLYNRRALGERAEIEFARARRSGAPIGMIVADVDDFKTLNDSLGHPAGDQMLIRIAGVLEDETREVDAVARVGGDEFAILLPGVGSSEARAIAERLRVAVRRSAGHAQLRLSLSVGVVVGSAEGESLEGLWKAADRAMYEAKRAGGDAVEVDGDRRTEPEVSRTGRTLWNHERMPSRRPPDAVSESGESGSRSITRGSSSSSSIDRLAVERLPRPAGPRAADTESYLLAVISALPFFASILLHELGHAFVSIRNGIGDLRHHPVDVRRRGADDQGHRLRRGRSSRSRSPGRS